MDFEYMPTLALRKCQNQAVWWKWLLNYWTSSFNESIKRVITYYICLTDY